MRKVIRTLVGVGSVIMAMAVTTSTAFAGSDYNGVAGEQTGGTSGGSLPFTGADLALYAVVGIAVVVSGLALRMMSRV